MVSLTFDATQVEPSAGFEPVPAGWYNVMIDDTEMRPTKKPGGAYLNVRFSIMDGAYANQKIFTRLNLQNESIQAKEIAFRQLSSICHAVGVLNLNDSSELHGRPMKIKVKITPDEQYGPSNDITSFKGINDPVPGHLTVVGPSAPANPATAPAGWGGATPAPVTPVAAAPVTPPTHVATPAPAPTPPLQVVDPAYQYTPDGKQRWKPGMATWELVPTPTAPPVVSNPPPATPPTPTGWTPPAAAQPWAQPAQPPAAPAPAAPAASTQPTPPWMQPRS